MFKVALERDTIRQLLKRGKGLRLIDVYLREKNVVFTFEGEEEKIESLVEEPNENRTQGTEENQS